MTTARLHHAWLARPRLINNPIILRELVTQLRKKQSFLLLFIFMAIVMHGLLSNWDRLIQDGHTYYIFYRLGLSVGIFLAIVSPLLSATSVNTEYEQETWDLLLTTHISLSSILLGKVLSSFLFVYILFLSIIPLFSLLMPFGGVSPQEIILFLIMGTEIMVVSTLVGLYCSIRFRRPVYSIFVSYVICAALLILPLFFPGLWFSPFFMWMFTFNTTVTGSFLNLFFLQIRFHLFILAEVFILLLLCSWNIKPENKERTLKLSDRLVVWISHFFHGKYLFLAGIILILGWWVPVLYLSNHWGQVEPIGFIDLIQYFLLFSIGLQLMIWIQCNVRLHQLWQSKPWEEVSSTPQKLRRFLFHCVGYSFHDYGRWLLALTPILLPLIFVQEITLTFLAWMIFSLIDAVILIATVSLFCSINKSTISQSLFLSFVGVLILMWGIPSVMVGIFHGFFFSPQFFFFIRTLNSFWDRPFWGFNEYLSGFIFYYIYVIIVFVLMILASQRRVLLKAGMFTNENVLKWLRRTVLNMMPQRGKTEPKPFPPLPDGYNPVFIKEVREYILSPAVRSSLIKWLCGMAFVSLFLLFCREELWRMYPPFRNPYPFILLLIPFLLIPIAANAFRREKDQNTWDILTTTSLSPRSLLNAKLLTSLFLFVLYSLALLLPILYADWGQRWIWKNDPYYFYALYISYGLLVINVSILFSAVMKKTVTAYIASFLASYTILLFPTNEFSPFHSLVFLDLQFRFLTPQVQFGRVNTAFFPTIYIHRLCVFILIYLLISTLIYAITYHRVRAQMK